MLQLTRPQLHVLLICYKYWYRSLIIEEIEAEIEKDGLETMTDEQLNQYRLSLIKKRKSELYLLNWHDERVRVPYSHLFFNSLIVKI